MHFCNVCSVVHRHGALMRDCLKDVKENFAGFMFITMGYFTPWGAFIV